MDEPTGDEIRELTAVIKARMPASNRSQSTATIEAGKAASWITAAAAMFIAGACISALIIGGIVALGYSQMVNTKIASIEQSANDAKTEFLAYKTRWDAERAKLQQQITDLQHEKQK